MLPRSSSHKHLGLQGSGWSLLSLLTGLSPRLDVCRVVCLQLITVLMQQLRGLHFPALYRFLKCKHCIGCICNGAEPSMPAASKKPVQSCCQFNTTTNLPNPKQTAESIRCDRILCRINQQTAHCYRPADTSLRGQAGQQV